jgi:hypothetical protein
MDTWANHHQLPDGPMSRKKTARVGVEVFAYVASAANRKRDALS